MVKNETRGTLYVIISALTYGLIGYFGMSIINEGVSVSCMLFWRFLLSSIIVGAFIIPKLRSLGKFRDLRNLFVFGGISYFITSITYFESSEYIGTGLAIVIFFTYPIFVAIINYLFFKIKICRKYLISIALIVVGMFCIIELKSLAVDVMGIFLAILSAVFYAVHVISTKEIKMDSYVSTFLIVLSSTLVSLLFSILDNTLAIPTSFDFIVNISGLTILCTVIPIILMLKGLVHITALKASILTVFEPVMVFIFGVILLGEQVTLIQTIGAIIILSGAVVTMIEPTLLRKMFSRNKPKPRIF